MVSTILANLEGCQERVLAGRLPPSLKAFRNYSVMTFSLTSINQRIREV